MANLQNYTLAAVYVKGALLTEEGAMTLHRKTNSEQVLTVTKGYAGESPGAPMCEIDVTNAVPSADFEMNPDQYMSNLSIAEIAIFAAGRTITVKGFIIEDTFSHAVNKASDLSFKFRGPMPLWK